MIDSCTVLLVEDTEDDYLLTREVFEEMRLSSYSLDWVKNAADALQRVQENPPNVVLLDYQLGADTGVEVLSWMQAEGFDGPVIMLTGQSLEGLDRQALEAGAVDYLAKSELNATNLSRALRFAVLRSEATQARLDNLRAQSDLQRAQTLSQAKTDFIAYMSHELRTPLAAMLGYTDLLRMKVKDEALLAYVDTISLNGRHLRNLMGDVLDISKIEAGRLRLEPNVASLRDLLGEVYSVAALQAIEKDVDFRVLVPGDLPETVSVDSQRLVQMLLNMLSNAVKFSPGGQVIWKIEYVAQPQPVIRFEVEDTGLGIAADELERIFEPFQQAANNGTGLGLGLGLSIIRSLAERMGGNIVARSTPGEGSVFTLTLPAQDPGALVSCSVADLQEVPELETPHVVLSGRALVVDDAEQVRSATAALLQQSGLSVEQACDGEEALDAVANAAEPIDLILLDMQMPGIEGYEVAQRLRADGFAGRIIAFTAAAMDGARQRCLGAGCDDYLSKPVETSLLLSKVRHWFSDRKVEGHAERSAGRVLVVENAAAVREATVDLLGALGFVAVGAGDSGECLSQLEEFKPDAVLLDLNLGEESGVALAREIAADAVHGDIFRIALSGNHRDSLAVDDLALFRDYLEKPMELAQLERILAQVGVLPEVQQPV